MAENSVFDTSYDDDLVDEALDERHGGRFTASMLSNGVGALSSVPRAERS